MSPLALGIDVGLSGVRAAVVNEEGALVATARRAYRNARFGGGIAEHDPGEWVELAFQVAREAVGSPYSARVAVVGVGALGPAPVLVDAALRPLTRAPLFALDRRAEDERLRLVAGLADEVAAATLDCALPKLAWWLKHEPEAAAEAAWALDATGFVVGSLTGVPVMDRITAADYRLPGVDSPVPLPEPVAADALAGRLTAGAAESMGVSADVPVVAGSYDSFVDIAAAGVRRPGDAGILLGSTMIVGRATEAAEPRDGLGVSEYPGEGVLLGGWTLSGGRVLDWAVSMFGDGRGHGELAAAAEAIPPGRVMALPYLNGERTPVWDAEARAALVGLGADSGPAEIYSAMIDSLALVVRDHTDRIDSALGPCPVWRVTGGGARNRAWLGATADAVGAPLEVAPDAGEAVGPALLGLRALGVDPARGLVERVEPDPERAALFTSLLPVFRELRRTLA